MQTLSKLCKKAINKSCCSSSCGVKFTSILVLGGAIALSMTLAHMYISPTAAVVLSYVYTAVGLVVLHVTRH